MSNSENAGVGLFGGTIGPEMSAMEVNMQYLAIARGVFHLDYVLLG
jgi:hypothetical protein